VFDMADEKWITNALSILATTVADFGDYSRTWKTLKPFAGIVYGLGVKHC